MCQMGPVLPNIKLLYLFGSLMYSSWSCSCSQTSGSRIHLATSVTRGSYSLWTSPSSSSSSSIFVSAQTRFIDGPVPLHGCGDSKNINYSCCNLQALGLSRSTWQLFSNTSNEYRIPCQRAFDEGRTLIAIFNERRCWGADFHFDRIGYHPDYAILYFFNRLLEKGGCFGDEVVELAGFKFIYNKTYMDDITQYTTINVVRDYEDENGQRFRYIRASELCRTKNELQYNLVGYTEDGRLINACYEDMIKNNYNRSYLNFQPYIPTGASTSKYQTSLSLSLVHLFIAMLLLLTTV